MARKRLLTILAGAVAVVGLQMAPASALSLEVDLGTAKVGVSVSEDGLKADLGDDEESKLEAGVSKDGVDAKVGDTEVSTRDLTDKASSDSSDSKDSEKKKESEKEKKDPGDDGSSSGSSGSTATSGGSTGGDSSSSGSSSSDEDREVTTAGGAESVEGSSSSDQREDSSTSRDEVAQARSLLPRSGNVDADPDDDVTPAFDMSTREEDVEVDDPIVAAPPESGEAHDWEPVAPEAERSDAELAAIPTGPAAGEEGAVPTGLKLIAGLLVAGTATVWHLARRELGTPIRITPRS